MQITIKNKLIIKGLPNTKIEDKIYKDLTFTNPVYEDAIKAGRSVYKIDEFIVNFEVVDGNTILAPRGYLNRLLSVLSEHNIKYDLKNKSMLFNRCIGKECSTIVYRHKQMEAVSTLLRNTEGTLIAPPGSGKTVMGISIIPILGQPTIWLTHTNRLVEQTTERIIEFIPELSRENIGFIGGGKWTVGNIITVAMVQTLIRKRNELNTIANKFGCLILDEAHHCPAATFREVVSQFNSCYRYGLTATPERRDGLEKLMYQTIGEITAEIPLDKLKEHNYLMLPEVKYRIIDGNRNESDDTVKLIKELVLNQERNNIIVNDVIKEAEEGNLCIVVTDRKVHAKKLYDMIYNRWEKTGIATGSYSKKHVNEQVEKLEKGMITILVTTSSLLGEGFDYAPLNRCFITLPFRAEAKTKQIIGRVQRPAPGKTNSIIYEYADINFPVLYSQFYMRSSRKVCRYNTYKKMGLKVTRITD